ncbi:putative endosomal sorting complex protein TSG101 [Aspergillus glaucus CBS 516.65]|uniref:UEV domain-containing protein n=1 Tax=Aspergillus glaucus CBS 516.65 TaxID=1160497 RepID=A0A1L9V864_ASPGL|nr:hypothetical protein ASPGLDRAFT_61346 [Aspergillus glaucus CBS 516.65]OJJ80085.1 hypothetical protein ASPGLDRAFT_61346 [Aspergillus glaucus CBS 516.65]
MAAVPQRTLNWLYSILIRDHYDPKQTYQDPNRTYYDVANALAQYPSLSPRTDVFTYETGFSTLLLLIAGTIPVPFRGTLYKFPVVLWIPTTYPHEPPMVYVTPTNDMVVRVGQHVTLEGRVYHHYLAHWLEAWDRSTIADLLAILRDVFATEPPVKYKHPIQQPQPQSMPTPPPVPPLPPGFGPSTMQSVPSPRPEAQVPPPPPPKPGQMVAAEQQQQTPPAGRYNSPPPLPPLPPEEQARRRSFSPQTGMSPGGMASPYRVPQQPHMAGPAYSGTPVSPAQNPGWQQPPRQYPPQQIPRHPAYQQQPVAPYPHSPMPHQRQLSQATPTTQPMPTPTPAPVQTAPKQPASAPDLLTSPFELELPSFAPTGPAPPIPPNPEKDALVKAVSKTLAETVQSNISQSESAAHSLTSQSHSLHNAIATLQAEISSLNSLNGTLQSNTSILQHSLQRADTVIADAQTRLSTKSFSPTSTSASPLPSTTDITQPSTSTAVQVQGLPPIDEILVAPTVVGKQLYDLVAEEAGIQQAIYALQVALVKGVIGVETWSRHTRGLAREAFLKRALGRKVAVGLGCEGV